MRSVGKWLMGLVAACAPLPVLAAPHAFLTARAPIAAPYGYTAMCGADPTACAPIATDVGAAPAPKDWELLLRRVNRQVNRHVRQVSDMIRFARRDVWQASGIGRGATGDCEDIALEKRKLLLAAGVPADRLFLALTYGRSGVGLHLVLIARTGAGDVVLDSRNADIAPWTNAPYTWIAIQSADQPDHWFSV